MARSGRKAKRQHLQLKNPHQQWSDKCMHKCQCHQSNMTPSASNLRPKYPAHGCCCLFGSSRGFAELQKKSKIGKKSVCAWPRSTFRLLATLFFLHCYTVFMIHLFTNKLIVTKTKKRGPKIASQLSLPPIPTAL